MNIRLLIKILVYAGSLLSIAIMSIATNVRNGQNIKDSFYIMLIAILPAIYSLIPSIKELILAVNRGKDRLTDDMFTDRESDMKHLLTILSSQDHRIEIKGEESCGKTWLAMRLCDYINNPKHKLFRSFKIKVPYKRAYYFDLREGGIERIENFFDSKIIMPTDVVIVDHVKNIDKLISKQNRYHFQMIYVMEQPIETDFSSHHISKFNIDNIAELHDKIRNSYPTLEELTRREFDKLFDLTNGNIGRISGMLREQKNIKWLKDITNGSRTEYDMELDKIQIELFLGHYKKAEKMLEEFNLEYSNSMKQIIDIKYKYLLMLSDCKHLLNGYSEALSILSLIELPDYSIYNKNHEIELHKAHYYKHLWYCDKALHILRNIKSESYSAIVDSLGILAAKYFINDLHVDFTDKNSIEVYKDYFVCAENSILTRTQADAYKLMRHKAVYEYYAQNKSNIADIIPHINAIIDIYSAENNRLLANAYFIQGEIYRLYKEYDNAIISYKNCLEITQDNNIIIQVNLMVYYLKIIKKLAVDFDIINNETIIALCEYNNYAAKVYRRIKCIERADPNATEIIECFDSRIMPIL